MPSVDLEFIMHGEFKSHFAGVRKCLQWSCKFVITLWTVIVNYSRILSRENILSWANLQQCLQSKSNLQRRFPIPPPSTPPKNEVMALQSVPQYINVWRRSNTVMKKLKFIHVSKMSRLGRRVVMFSTCSSDQQVGNSIYAANAYGVTCSFCELLA
jgi:hypothetical protein